MIFKDHVQPQDLGFLMNEWTEGKFYTLASSVTTGTHL